MPPEVVSRSPDQSAWESDWESDDEEDAEKKAKRKRMIKKCKKEGLPVSWFGNICHFCKRETVVGSRVMCSRCPLGFCGPCLLWRHGENIEEEMEETVHWVCPVCRGGCGLGCLVNCCTCGPCRKYQQLGPAGRCKPAVLKAGFNNVHDYLVHFETSEPPEVIAKRKDGRGWTKARPVVDRPDYKLKWAFKKIRSFRQKHSQNEVQKQRKNGEDQRQNQGQNQGNNQRQNEGPNQGQTEGQKATHCGRDSERQSERQKEKENVRQEGGENERQKQKEKEKENERQKERENERPNIVPVIYYKSKRGFQFSMKTKSAGKEPVVHKS